MTEINNLCFDSDQFLRLLAETDLGESVYFDNRVYGTFWKGVNQNNFYTISIVRDELEIDSIIDKFRGFCPCL